MHIELDDELCEANGICQKHAPTIFEVTDTDELIIRNDAYSEALREEVEMAIRMCPRQALSLKP
jgi:ferredoxin